jgi:ureidoglycolate hydrolase
MPKKKTGCKKIRQEVPNLIILRATVSSHMISLLENHMFSTQALLVMVLILSSAVAVKAGVYYGVGRTESM